MLCQEHELKKQIFKLTCVLKIEYALVRHPIAVAFNLISNKNSMQSKHIVNR